jgi:hypothetical protein
VRVERDDALVDRAGPGNNLGRGGLRLRARRKNQRDRNETD